MIQDLKPETIAQWAVDNRFPKSELDKVSDHEYYHSLVQMIKDYAQSKEPDRVEIASRVMAALYSNELNGYNEHSECAKRAVAATAALINELKK